MHWARSGTRNAGKGFNGRQVGKIVGGSVHVIHPVGIRNELVPGLAFADFLNPPVMIADVHVEIRDSLAIKRQNKPHQAVRADVMRPQVKQQILSAVRLSEKHPGVQRLMEPGIRQRVRGHFRGSSGIVFRSG